MRRGGALSFDRCSRALWGERRLRVVLYADDSCDWRRLGLAHTFEFATDGLHLDIEIVPQARHRRLVCTAVLEDDGSASASSEGETRTEVMRLHYLEGLSIRARCSAAFSLSQKRSQAFESSRGGTHRTKGISTVAARFVPSAGSDLVGGRLS
jgi:hypothetical protein